MRTTFRKRFSFILIFTAVTLAFDPQVEEDFGTGKFVKYQICLWDLIEKPHTSFAAKVSHHSQRDLNIMLQILCLFCHPQLFLMLSLTGDFFDFDSLCRCLHDRDDPEHNAPDPTQGFVIFVSSLFDC